MKFKIVILFLVGTAFVAQGAASSQSSSIGSASSQSRVKVVANPLVFRGDLSDDNDVEMGGVFIAPGIPSSETRRIAVQAPSNLAPQAPSNLAPKGRFIRTIYPDDLREKQDVAKAILLLTGDIIAMAEYGNQTSDFEVTRGKYGKVFTSDFSHIQAIQELKSLYPFADAFNIQSFYGSGIIKDYSRVANDSKQPKISTDAKRLVLQIGELIPFEPVVIKYEMYPS